MTLEEYTKIGEMLRSEMIKAEADTMDYYQMSKLVAGMALFDLMTRGADVEEAVDMWIDSMRKDLVSSLDDMKSKYFIVPN